MPDIDSIHSLKRDFLCAEDFNELLGRFFSCVEEDPALVTGARTCQALWLQQLLAQVAGSMLLLPELVFCADLVHVPEVGLVHGRCVASGRPGVVIWFEDLRAGLLALVLGEEMRFVRFTCVGGIDSPDRTLN